MVGKNNFTMKTRYGAMAATAIPFIIIGGAYIALAYWNRGRRGKNRVNKRSIALAALHGGKLALERLLNYQEARANAQTLASAVCELNVLIEDDKPDFLKMQRVVAKLEMSGKEAEAVEILQEGLKDAQKGGKIHEAYEIEMFLVEMHIYKGEFDKAHRCKCLTDESVISDARRPLYKAIILVASESPRFEVEAKKCWEQFNEMREEIVDPPSLKESMQECLEGNGICKLATNFDEFTKIVKRLKVDINSAKAKNIKSNIGWKSKK